MKMEQTECAETSAYKIQTPGNYPEERIQISVVWNLVTFLFALLQFQFIFMAKQPLLGSEPSHYRYFTITLRHTRLGKTPLDEWSIRLRDFYLTTHNTHNRHTSMPPAGLEPTNSNPRFRNRGRWDHHRLLLYTVTIFLFFLSFFLLPFFPWRVSFFLEAFEELRIVTVSFVVFVCPSVRMRHLAFHRTDFHWIWIFFESMSRESKFH
jgi:hypothetical protein